MPDDVSMHDHVGHGTALAHGGGRSDEHGAGGHDHGGGAQSVPGAATKIYGSPGVNDGPDDATIVAALEDAVKDGMDVAVLSIGGGAFSAPLDQGRFAATQREFRAICRLRGWKTRSAPG